MRIIFIITLCIVLSACVHLRHKPCIEAQMCFEGKEITYHYGHINKETGEFEYTFYIHVDRNGDISFVPKKNREFRYAKQVLRRAKNGAYIQHWQYRNARTRGLTFDNVEQTYFSKGERGYQDALEYTFIDAFGYYFLLEIGGETKNLAPILCKNEELLDRDAFPALYNEKGESVSSIYWHGVSEETLPTTSNSIVQTHPPQCKQKQ